jgi:predicted DNA-binding protein YlxM (UPF0122 family)
MTPKEKAEQLINKFFFDTTLNELEEAKDCALIAVDEIMKECEKFFEAISENRKLFWQEVKQEIEKL